MWNSFLDKAIKAAEVLDKQLNESVGVTNDENQITTSTFTTEELLSTNNSLSNQANQASDDLVEEDWEEECQIESIEQKAADNTDPPSDDKNKDSEPKEPPATDVVDRESIVIEKDGRIGDETEFEDANNATNVDDFQIPDNQQTFPVEKIEKNQHPSDNEIRIEDDADSSQVVVEIFEAQNVQTVKGITTERTIPDVSLNEELTTNEKQKFDGVDFKPEEEMELVISKPSPPPMKHVQEINLDPSKQIADSLVESQLEDVRQLLKQREKQLVAKNEELAEMQLSFQMERDDLLQKIQSTKDEAKRRIAKAKERVEIVEKQLQNFSLAQSGMTEAATQKDEVISALRREGEKLAHKQAEMEKAVRIAKADARELRENLQVAISDKEDGLKKITSLEMELANVKESLLLARRGESNAEKLENELRLVRDESERRHATILSLEQHVKELKSQNKTLSVELEESKKGAAAESELERKKLMKEQNELVKDLENTIRVIEREAAMREDGLRHEVEEIRRRWQDAVRRADALSIDIQTSTAPLLRQLDSVNKQNRARASAWTELETQLRSELEENISLNEALSKERNDWRSKFSRCDRLCKEQEEQLKKMKKSLDEKSIEVDDLSNKLRKLEEESSKMKKEWTEVEKLANEGVSRVRSEMTKTLVENEERYRSQMESLKSELNQEKDLRRQLELQVQGLLDNTGIFVTPDLHTQPHGKEESKPKKLRQSEGQASILTNTLSGFLQESDDEAEEEDAESEFDHFQSGSSFAALDQLTSNLKAAKNEIQLLRSRLETSEKTREDLAEALSECRNAKEKLPLFEAKVKELTNDNFELTQEVRGLREDIADVRELYRTQLNSLLEERASSANLNGEATNVEKYNGNMDENV